MIYQEFVPQPALRPFVRSFYYFCGDGEASGTSSNFCFPSDGAPELIVNIGDPFFAGGRPDCMRSFSGCRLIGPLSAHLMTRTTGLTAFVAVRFSPGGTLPFFRKRCASSVSGAWTWGCAAADGAMP